MSTLSRMLTELPEREGIAGIGVFVLEQWPRISPCDRKANPQPVL